MTQKFFLSFVIWLGIALCSFGQSLSLSTNPVYQAHYLNQNRIIIKTDQGFLSLQPWAEGIIRLEFNVDSMFTLPSDAVILSQHAENFSTTVLANGLQLNHGNQEIAITFRPLNVSLVNKTNNQPLNIKPLANITPSTERGFAINLIADEKITGGGARAINLNRRGHRLYLNNEPHWGYGFGEETLNYSLPVFVSSKGYLVFYDAPQRAWADIGKTHEEVFALTSLTKQNSCFIITGNSYPELLKQYTNLTGTQPLPPRWALGNLQSRFGYRSQRETIEKTDSILSAGYPLDAMIIDLYWFGKGVGDFRMGNLTWEPENWPSPREMVNNLKSKGVKTILITEPYILQSSTNWKQTDSLGILGKDSLGNSFVIKDFWFGPGATIDVFNPHGAQWFWNHYKRLKDYGIAGWWGDLGEPERHPSGIYYDAGTSDEVHNIYGHFWSKLLYDGYSREYPHERVFFLNRAGYAGSQRYGIFPWSGDVSRSWSGFRAQLPIMLGMSLNGIPYMHSDLGGFAAGTKDEELYRRWLQFGTFNPIFRPHGESIPSEPIYFNDTTQRIVKEFIKLRYRLMPYNYTLAYQQTTQGLPLARPLIWYHPENEALFDVADTYYWGENFLVSPVLEQGAKSKSIPLPNGVWFDFFTNQKIVGGKTIDYAVNDETIPVFVKAGSIIPLTPEFFSTDNYPVDTLQVICFADKSVAQSSYSLYEDDGVNARALEEKQYRITQFGLSHHGNSITITINSNGKYETMKPVRILALTVKNMVHKPGKIKVGNKTLKKSQFRYSSGNSELNLWIEDKGLPITISVQTNNKQ
jgi:oligosaccharide 4-alpha-D-glucosyltransferase